MSEQGDKARKALHDLRWGPHTEGVIERQEVMDNAIRVALQVVTALEADADALLAVVKAAESLDMLLGALGAHSSLAESGPDADLLRDALAALPEHLRAAPNQEENPHLFPGMNAAMLYPPNNSKKGRG